MPYSIARVTGELSYPHDSRADVMAVVLPDEIVYLPALEQKQG